MTENILKQIFVEIYDEEYAQYENASEHEFSPRHSKRMKKIFKLYEKNTAHLREMNKKTFEPAKTKRRPNVKTIIIIAVIAFLGIITGFAGVKLFFSRSFKGEVFVDNTEMFAINTENCPSIIGEKYIPAYIPEGFELAERSSVPVMETYIYTTSDKERAITFCQCVKPSFDIHLNTEKHKIEKTEINGYECLIIDYSDHFGDYIEMIIDSKDYIFELGGGISRAEAFKIANSIKPEDFVDYAE